MLKSFLSDLHIHTCLSPCAEIEMLPVNILSRARGLGLNAIGIADHNSAENIAPMKSAADRSGIGLVMGMEINSSEDVHILAYFDKLSELLEMQAYVYQHLTELNDGGVYGEQVVVDDKSEPVRLNERLLIGSATLSAEQITSKIHELNGLAVAAHIDREAYGIIGQLGFIPVGLKLDAVEISSGTFRDIPAGLGVITGSDAHVLADIGKNTAEFIVEEMSISEMRKALRNENGRSVTAHFGHR